MSVRKLEDRDTTADRSPLVVGPEEILRFEVPSFIERFDQGKGPREGRYSTYRSE